MKSSRYEQKLQRRKSAGKVTVQLPVDAQGQPTLNIGDRVPAAHSNPRHPVYLKPDAVMDKFGYPITRSFSRLRRADEV